MAYPQFARMLPIFYLREPTRIAYDSYENDDNL